MVLVLQIDMEVSNFILALQKNIVNSLGRVKSLEIRVICAV